MPNPNYRTPKLPRKTRKAISKNNTQQRTVPKDLQDNFIYLFCAANKEHQAGKQDQYPTTQGSRKQEQE